MSVKNYQITTDSGCDLSLAVCEAHGIRPYKMPFTIDGITYTDDMTEDSFRNFYDMLRAGKTSTTTQINPNAFMEFWKPMAEAGTPVLHISLTAAISGTYANALTAAELLKQDYPDWECRVIDSTNASTGFGMLMLRAAANRDDGCSLDDNVKALEETKHNINAIFTTDDLTALYRGGRVSRASAAFGTMLNIIPIMRVAHDGHLEVFKKARGAKQCKNFILATVKEQAINPAEQTLFVADADNYEKAHEFGDALKEEVGFKDVFYTHIGPIIGSHTGENLISVFFVGKDRP